MKASFLILTVILPQVNTRVADFRASHGIDDGYDVMDQKCTIEYGTITVIFGEVVHYMESIIHGK